MTSVLVGLQLGGLGFMGSDGRAELSPRCRPRLYWQSSITGFPSSLWETGHPRLSGQLARQLLIGTPGFLWFALEIFSRDGIGSVLRQPTLVHSSKGGIRNFVSSSSKTHPSMDEFMAPNPTGSCLGLLAGGSRAMAVWQRTLSQVKGKQSELEVACAVGCWSCV